MPVTGIRQEFELSTRNQYTKVTAEIGFKVEKVVSFLLWRCLALLLRKLSR